ncbi:hypothetical protein BJ165DRAFT_1512328, partial [Panaeolus papilionaceus]
MIRPCLAIASIGRAIPRQSNRHHLVVQAILTKYHKLWGTTAVGVWEVGCNFGRTFQLDCISVG